MFHICSVSVSVFRVETTAYVVEPPDGKRVTSKIRWPCWSAWLTRRAEAGADVPVPARGVGVHDHVVGAGVVVLVQVDDPGVVRRQQRGDLRGRPAVVVVPVHRVRTGVGAEHRRVQGRALDPAQADQAVGRGVDLGVDERLRAVVERPALGVRAGVGDHDHRALGRAGDLVALDDGRAGAVALGERDDLGGCGVVVPPPAGAVRAGVGDLGDREARRAARHVDVEVGEPRAELFVSVVPTCAAVRPV